MTGDPDWLVKARAAGAVTGETAMNLAALLGGQGVNLEAAPRRESTFTHQVIDLAQTNGWLAVHFRSVRVARPDGTTYWQCPVEGDEGFPDCVFLRDRLVVAELKVKTAVKPEQERWLNGFRAVGIAAYVWKPADFDEIRKVLA